MTASFQQPITMSDLNFNHLSPNLSVNTSNNPIIGRLWQAFYHSDIRQEVAKLTYHLSDDDWRFYQSTWQNLHRQSNLDEHELTAWLIRLFNHIFSHQSRATPTHLAHSAGEPEYFAPKNGKPACIAFAHGFFASALHEISHWCVAGKQRRQLDDFGYWYCPDGRDQATQKLFEQVEIKPQAIECLLSLALGRYFYVSQDNLNATFDTSDSTFAIDVFNQAQQFLQNPHTLPKDARSLLWLFLHLCHHPLPQQTW